MGNVPPEYCHYCGGDLAPVDPPTVHRCEACREYVFYNPAPSARVVVLDDGAVLLVKADVPDLDAWAPPGGMVEAGEDPDVAGARELREETTVEVDPDDLVLFDARTVVEFERLHKTYLAYAVDAAAVTGTPRPDDEVVAARFRTPTEFDAAGDRLFPGWPDDYRDLEWWADAAGTAIERAGSR